MGGGDIINYLSAEAEAPPKEKRRKCNIGPRKTISSLPPSDFLPPPNERPKEKKCGRALLLMHSREGHFRIWPTGNKINRQGVSTLFWYS